jgi:hypothetical protein
MIRVVAMLTAALAAVCLIGAGPAAASDGEQWRVRTAPALPGVRIAVGEDVVTTGPDGTALVPVEGGRLTAERLEVIDRDVTVDENTRARFSRFYTIEGAVTATFEIERRIGFRFRDLAGSTVSSEDLDELRIKSTVGEVHQVEMSEPTWLLAQRVVRHFAELTVKDVMWTVEDATVSGSSVVNRSQQRFFPTSTEVVDVELLFYTARFRVFDAFFGTPRGRELEITSPDGQLVRHPIDAQGVVELHALPRGTYTVRVLGAGLQLPQPMVLSRDQDMDLRFYSWLDVAVFGGAFAAFVLGLLAAGWRLRRRHVRSAVTAEAGGSADRGETPADHGRRDPSSSPPGRRHGLLGPWLLLIATALPFAGAWTAVPADPPVLAHYYLWYDATSWNRAKSDYPSLGRYTSDQTSVLREHVRLAKSAGIDGFIVSWKSTERLDRRLAALVDIAEEEDFALALTYQALDHNREPLPVQRMIDDLDRFVETHGASPAFDLFGTPLVAWTGTWRFSTEHIERLTDHFRGQLLVLATERDVDGYRRVAHAVDGELYYWSSADPVRNPRFREKLIELGAEVHANGDLWIAPVAPGFDARLVGGTMVVPRREGDTLRALWEGALASLPHAIGVISWNEFSENTHIEPSERHGARALEQLATLSGFEPAFDFDVDSSDDRGATTRSAPRLLSLGGLAALFVLAAVRVARREGGAS